MRRLKQTAGGAALAAAFFAAALPVGATEGSETDPRWLAWVGCWVPDGGGEDHLLCVQSIENDAAVRMVTYAEGRIVSEETVRADGEQRPTQRDGCNGWESARFSDDGRRVYLRSEFACDGDVRRSSSGLISMTSPMMWLDVQSVGVEGQSAVRVIRYRLAPPQALESAGVAAVAEDRPMAVSAARTAASAPLSIAAVIDASAHVAPEAVEAWIVERGERLALSADALIEMADAGVPESVIDLAVAVSFPNTFAVDSEARDGEYRPVDEEEFQRPDHYAYPGYYDPFYWDPFRYSRYGSYYSPYGWGGYGWYPGYRPVIVIVSPDDDGSASPPGRVVRGRGYTRGGRTVSEPSGSGSYRSPPGGSSGTATSTRPSTGSSTGTAAPARRAKPRGGGTGTGGL